MNSCLKSRQACFFCDNAKLLLYDLADFFIWSLVTDKNIIAARTLRGKPLH